MEIVSIITPCYNSEKYINETYFSIRSQSYNNWEWIIVDDGSTDDSIQIIKSWDDQRVILIELKENKGAANARNIGLKMAKGRYITFIDSDDLWKPNFLDKSIKFLKFNNEALVYATYHRVDENLNPLLEDFVAIDNVDRKRILYNCPIPMLTSVYDVQKVGKVFFPEVELREDHAMWINLLLNVNFARAIQEPLAFYRIRNNSVSRNKLNIAKKQYQLYRKFLKMNVFEACFYTASWALNGLKKYGKL